MTTILDILEKGAQFLNSKGIEDARLNMELLVAHELGCRRMDLYLRFDQLVPEEKLPALREHLKKRSQRIPLQHLTKVVHFYSHDFISDHRALIPRPESEELVSLVLKETFPKPARILDLGCGSGVLGLSLAKALGTDFEQLVLADLSTEALSLAKENAEALQVPAEIVQCNLFLGLEGRFDLIIANLPYIGESEREDLSKEVRHDPEIALFSGSDGLDLLRLFASQCSPFLNPGGLVALEVGHSQGETVCDLLRGGGLTEISLRRDLTDIPRFPLARKG
ncbi:MAG: peptide chain release factor N(5)-glutamine methyltransferase [Akkermansiaceae bacterium]|nr:peptide chain release factor N(5)-glutamine methyltransferase [Akkermansiaceae bacterium]